MNRVVACLAIATLALVESARASAGTPVLTIAEISRDGHPAPSADDIVIRDIYGNKIATGVRVGQPLREEVEIDVTSSRESLVITSGRSRLTIEPNSIVTLLYLGNDTTPGVERTAVLRGKATVDDPLDFYRVTSHAIDLSHHTTVFSVQADAKTVRVACTEGAVDATVLATLDVSTPVGSAQSQGGKELSQARRIDRISATGTSSVTYTLGDTLTASVSVDDDRSSAARGEAEGEYNLGIRYAEGDSVPVDNSRALVLLTRSADQDFLPALNGLGNIYGSGLLGIQVDRKKGIELLRRAADRNYAPAQDNLANLIIFDNGDVQEALEWFHRAAAQGDTNAEENIGSIYEIGSGVTRDLAQAFYWYSLAGAQGDANAQSDLARLYLNGTGIRKDGNRARYWAERAAAQSDEGGLYWLGYMDEYGIGGPIDYASAVDLLRRSMAARGSRAYATLQKARYELGNIYANGWGVAKDASQAEQLYTLPAEFYMPEACLARGKLYRAGAPGVPQDLEKAARDFRCAAAGGIAEGARLEAEILENGHGHVLPDPVLALQYWQRAAKLGDAAANCVVRLIDATSDFEAARPYCEAGAAAGDAAAEGRLGYMYSTGKGEAVDYARAFKLDSDAAAQGDLNAENNLGYAYEHGQGVKQDYAQALDWYKKAADSGLPRAQYHLGSMYERGEGVPVDAAQALFWYTKAADQGDADAKAAIDRIVHPTAVPQ